MTQAVEALVLAQKWKLGVLVADVECERGWVEKNCNAIRDKTHKSIFDWKERAFAKYCRATVANEGNETRIFQPFSAEQLVLLQQHEISCLETCTRTLRRLRGRLAEILDDHRFAFCDRCETWKYTKLDRGCAWCEICFAFYCSTCVHTAAKHHGHRAKWISWYEVYSDDAD